MDSDEKDKLTGIAKGLISSNYDINLNLPTLNISEIDFNSINVAQGNVSSGYTYTTSGTSIPVISGSGALGASQVTWPQINPYTVGTLSDTNSGAITVQGENADIVIRGKSMVRWMEQIEERLNILSPNVQLEAEWEELRELGDRYRELEKRCKEKTEVWNKLKKMPPPVAL